MLTPAVLSRATFFYALGNTPASNIARGIPHGVDANILLLGCGDVRNILFTIYEGQASPKKLDFTCCDVETSIIARNVVFLSLMLDVKLLPVTLWNIYYHLSLDDADVQRIGHQAEKLLKSSSSLEDWTNGPYGKLIGFGDAATLENVRRAWSKYAEAASSRASDAYARTFKKLQDDSLALGASLIGKGWNLTAARSAAPLFIEAMEDVGKVHGAYWETGVAYRAATKPAMFPNPLFAATLTPSFLLHYGTNPILGFHLAPAYARLTGDSPLRPIGTGKPDAVAAAMLEFKEWVLAFQNAVARGGVRIRFVDADAIAFCNTLQAYGADGETTAHWFRRQHDPRRLELDGAEYAARRAPTSFDAIDTSNLADHLGALNLLAAAVPLLRRVAWASLYTELLLRRDGTARERLDAIMCGDARAAFLLLGCSPVEYWTNATVASDAIEAALAIAHGAGPEARQTQSRSRLTWKANHLMAGMDAPPDCLELSDADAAAFVARLYDTMFRGEDGLGKAGADATTDNGARSAFSHFHRGSFVAAFSALSNRTDPRQRNKLVGDFLEGVEQHPKGLGKQFVEELRVAFGAAEMHSSSPRDDERPHLLDGWRDIPWSVYATLSVPKSAVDKLFPSSATNRVGVTVQVCVQAAPDKPGDASLFADVHLSFGRVQRSISSSGDGAEQAITIEQDPLGWEGDSPLCVTVRLETARLHVDSNATVGLRCAPSPQSLAMQAKTLGPDLVVFQTRLEDAERVHITRLPPNQTAHRLDGPAHVKASNSTLQLILASSGEVPGKPRTEMTTVEVAMPFGAAGLTLTRRVDLSRDVAKARLIADKSSGAVLAAPTGSTADAVAASPYAVDVVLGKSGLLAVPLKYPLPVEVAGGGAKTRVARRSGYVDAVLPVGDPSSAGGGRLAGYMLPTVLAPVPAGGGSGSPTQTQLVPVPLNLHAVDLDRLPMLQVSVEDEAEADGSATVTAAGRALRRANGWLVTLASLTWSPEERAVRAYMQQQQQQQAGMTTPPGRRNMDDPAATARVNFKESLFSMFMLASGLQGGQTGLFALSRNDGADAGIQMLILVAGVRLDPAAGSVVLDAAVVVFEKATFEAMAPSGGGKVAAPVPGDDEGNRRHAELRAFLRTVRGLQICSVDVDGVELAMWRRALPAMAERCRAGWSHDAERCEYLARGATVPLSSEQAGGPVLCSCGRGKRSIPDGFVAVPNWEPGGRDAAVRIAISPVFASAAVEDLLGSEEMGTEEGSGKGAEVQGRQGEGGRATGMGLADSCRNCGKVETDDGKPLKRCTRCLEAKYCSALCQKKDWKKHRMECAENEVHGK